MIALAVLDGELPFDDSTRAALARLSAARSCVAACPHGYDIASIIADYTQQWAAADPVTGTP
jgi:Fe-S oxidoreductase